MRARNIFWLIAALAVIAVTVALAALIVALMPNDPNAATASMQQQLLEPKLESLADSHRRTK